MSDLDAHIEAASALVGLTVAEASRPGVRNFLAVARDMAAALEAVPLDPAELALAPVFRLPEPS